MNKRIKEIMRDFIPPLFLKMYLNITTKYGFFANYSNWEEAKKASTGYDSDLILNKVSDSLLKIKAHEAVYERDSILFDKIEYSWPLLTGLMWIAANEDGKLNLIDFGGSLGSSYYQNRLFLQTLKEVKWNIVEQKHFVECGKKYFEDDTLKFYKSIEECLRTQTPSTMILSGVIQYIEKPYELIDYIIKKNFKYLIFDRTTFNKRNVDKLVVQKINPTIFSASYPCWFLNKNKFAQMFDNKYVLINEFKSFENSEDRNSPLFNGFIFILKQVYKEG
ncbi:MAG TPA: methyltransferase, TIGR04325 family [Candidatus Brocadiaceae bacterium]|nr:methyltransferase, TIGR04325 family [Candidatus Brocadiaceae bacterium]